MPLRRADWPDTQEASPYLRNVSETAQPARSVARTDTPCTTTQLPISCKLASLAVHDTHARRTPHRRQQLHQPPVSSLADRLWSRRRRRLLFLDPRRPCLIHKTPAFVSHSCNFSSPRLCRLAKRTQRIPSASEHFSYTDFGERITHLASPNASSTCPERLP